MIQEDFVGFEIAKLLKEERFDVPYRSYYTNNGKRMFTGNGYYNNEDYERLYPNENTCVACPQALVLKWLRVEHGIHIEAHVWWGASVNLQYFALCIIKEKDKFNWSNKFKPVGKTFSSPEKATEAAIMYCLKNLIK